MYKVLLVDDERIILEGISQIIDWGSLGTVLTGTARNGLEAYEMVKSEPPDIIISDIKMPGMDGLQLVATVQESFPAVRFIMLSGFGEFEYARSSMQYGVKHFLLKPCNEGRIMEALAAVVAELRLAEHKEQFVQQTKTRLEKVLPYTKEQLLKEFVTNHIYGNRDLEYYQRLFQLEVDNEPIRLVLLQLEGDFSYEHLFAMKNIAEDLLQGVILSTTIAEQILLLIRDTGQADQIYAAMDQVRTTFFAYYQIDATIAISDTDLLMNAKSLYKDTLECLAHRFYLGEGSLITRKDIVHGQPNQKAELVYDEQRLCLLIKSGRWEDAKDEIDAIFAQLVTLRHDIPITKSYVIQLFVSIIRLCNTERFNAYMEKKPALIGMDTIPAMHQFLESVTKEIALFHYEQNKSTYSAIVRKVIDIIHKHLGDSDLTINGVASKMLYMNPDYLGKLFKKETGEKFSHYVTRLRIEKAIEQINRSEDVKIFELAEMLGFGGNPQYFSQVFKKYTGVTPTEYRKAPMM
ncbi:response regulator transcription factor [Brevibacillus migulae]|uniref:response regulator transcription factor n=1 Tax=Brevibacillus migulae TaxID=1644114 RepID=UPI00106E2E17|nr:response regulator transcription factor [Brevibacillus migulae]